RGRDNVNASRSPSYFNFTADPRGDSTTMCMAPSSVRAGSLSRFIPAPRANACPCLRGRVVLSGIPSTAFGHALLNAVSEYSIGLWRPKAALEFRLAVEHFKRFSMDETVEAGRNEPWIKPTLRLRQRHRCWTPTCCRCSAAWNAGIHD